MCGGGGGSPAPAPPPVVVTDPVADAAKNANLATNTVNAQLAQQRKRAQMASLFTVGASGLSPTQMSAAPSLFMKATPGG